MESLRDLRYVPRVPKELAIPAESIVVDGIDTEFPELGDTGLTVTAAIWNYGRVLKGAPFDSDSRKTREFDPPSMRRRWIAGDVWR